MKKFGLVRLYLMFLVASVGLNSAATATEGEGKIKVHKPLIAVSEPDAKGLVKVIGQPGAIESSSPATAWLISPATKEKVVLTLNADGSFAGAIAAKPGEKIKVLAKNQQKKQSYGTFKVPGTVEPPPPTPEKEPKQPKTPENPPESPKEPEKDKSADTEKPESPAADEEK